MRKKVPAKIKKNPVGRPKILDKVFKKQVISHFPQDLIQIANAKARNEGTSVSEIIRRLVTGWVRGSVTITSKGVA
jgi:hypothetical protein